MDSGVRRQFTGEYSSGTGNEDPGIPLSNLSVVSQKMESLQEFLAESVRRNTLLGQDQMEMVSTEISSAIHQIIVNGTALLTCWQSLGCRSCSGYDLPTNTKDSGWSEFDLKLKGEEIVDVEGSSSKVVEIDAVELLAEHVHFCEICGKGFKRDANLRMHMRAHGNQFKTPEALAKPTEPPPSSNRFSCPFVGCNRNKSHNKFQPLKSVICVKNHFKRSHCPKMYSCNRCNNKSFSVISDLKSHIKHCGESKWRCSCGTTFSRKDKLFQHMALFEGHMPAEEDDEKKPSIMMSMGGAALKMEEHGEQRRLMVDTQLGIGGDLGFNGMDPDPGLFDGLLDGLGSFESDYLKDVFGSPMPDTRIEGLFDMQSIASGRMKLVVLLIL